MLGSQIFCQLRGIPVACGDALGWAGR